MFHQIFPPFINLIKTDRNKTRQIVSDKSQDVLPRPITAHIASANHSTNQDHATNPDQSARTRYKPHRYKYRGQFYVSPLRQRAGPEQQLSWRTNSNYFGPPSRTSSRTQIRYLGPPTRLNSHFPPYINILYNK